jgi:hypothetical protein
VFVRAIVSFTCLHVMAIPVHRIDAKGRSKLLCLMVETKTPPCKGAPFVTYYTQSASTTSSFIIFHLAIFNHVGV